MKMSFNYDANKTHFHNKGFALSLVLKVRFFGTRKWPIQYGRRIGKKVYYAIRWIVIYPVDSALQRLSNRALGNIYSSKKWHLMRMCIC